MIITDTTCYPASPEAGFYFPAKPQKRKEKIIQLFFKSIHFPVNPIFNQVYIEIDQ